MSSLEDALHDRLHQRKAADRYRHRLTLSSAQATEIELDGSSLLNFCSNDYLGLADHDEIKTAMRDASASFGVGSGASHLVCGHSEHHHLLEQELAEFTGRDRALLFSSGFMANIGVIASLMDRKDAVFQDKLNHASLIDGAMQSRARLCRYRHGNVDHLDTLLQKTECEHRLVISDGVFSMDGDVAPLPDLVERCAEHDAWLMIDDAHGFGVLGEGGRGSVNHFNLSQAEVPILIGTLGKAFGTFGAFVAGSEALIESLIQFARTYIYTTAIPPAIASASRSALRLLRDEEWRRDQLNKNIAFFKAACDGLGIQLMPSNSPIQPVVVGSDKLALTLSEKLRQRNILVTAIRPPTVPEGSARLRITLCTTHSQAQIQVLVDALAESLSEVGQPVVEGSPSQ